MAVLGEYTAYLQCVFHKYGSISLAICYLRFIYPLIRQVYVAWTGTDARGFYFKSAAARFSRLNNLQLKQYTSARKAETVQNHIK
jgi:hypothetical protein